MTLKRFEEFIKLGIVKKQTPNKARAQSIIEEAKNKKQYFFHVGILVPKAMFLFLRKRNRYPALVVQHLSLF